MGGQSERSLANLAAEQVESGCYANFGVLMAAAVALGFALLVSPAVGLALAALMGIAVGWRLLTLRRLCAEGVEVEAHLTDVSSDFSGETSFRTSTYRYEYDGASYDFQISAVDFFVGQATRHGERIVLLVDPTRPRRAVFLRAG